MVVEIMKIEKIKLPIYHGTLIVIKTKKMSKVAAKYDLKNCDDCDAITFVRSNKKGIKKYFVAFENKKPSIIAHETVHVVNYIYQHHCIELDRFNDEPQAYLTGFIFDEIYKSLNKKK